jgi:hypothetical protein
MMMMINCAIVIRAQRSRSGGGRGTEGAHYEVVAEVLNSDTQRLQHMVCGRFVRSDTKSEVTRPFSN